MQDLLDTLNNKAIELVIAGIAIIILAIGRVVFTRERRNAEKQTARRVSNEELLEKLEGMDRAMAQRFESLHKDLTKQIEDKNKEDLRQSERLHDRFNQLTNQLSR